MSLVSIDARDEIERLCPGRSLACLIIWMP